MAKTKQQKSTDLETLKDQFGRMKSAVFTGYRGMTVTSVNKLRSNLRKQQMDYKVAKKTLLTKAAADAKIEGFNADLFTGPTAIIISYEDEVAPAKAAKTFSKEDENLVIFAGIMNGALIAKDKVVQLAGLPGIQELRAKLLGTFMGPVSGFVRVANGPLAGFARVLSELSKRGS